MHSRLTSKLALVLFMGFISAAMTVDTSSEELCHLRIVGTGWHKTDYFCAGSCENGANCAVWYELWTMSCGCGPVEASGTCSGEFDYSPDGIGLFCICK